MNKENSLVVFQDKKIRRIWHNNEWYFSVVDVISVLTDNDFQSDRKYWNKLAQRLREEGNESVTNCHQLKMQASDNKFYLTDAANTEQIFRLIQSIPSRKAAPSGSSVGFSNIPLVFTLAKSAGNPLAAAPTKMIAPISLLIPV